MEAELLFNYDKSLMRKCLVISSTNDKDKMKMLNHTQKNYFRLQDPNNTAVPLEVAEFKSS